MGPVHIRPPDSEVREAAQAAFEQHRPRVLAELAAAEVEHVGSTAIAGAWTKGDIDLLVRVCAREFDDAVAALGRLYTVHQLENWTTTFASFIDAAATDPAVGIQLVVTGSPDDAMLLGFRDALIGDRALLTLYNALKRRHEGGDYADYAAAKADFVAHVMQTNTLINLTNSASQAT